MGTYARAVTDEKGRNLGGLSDLGLRAERYQDAPRSPFDVAMGKYSRCHLGDLLTNKHYHLLARYLVDDLRVLASTPCRVAKRGIIRSIRIQGKEYRSDSIRIYRKKETDDES